MCGIAGLWIQDGASEAELRQAIEPMTAAVRHRGPDGDGIWTDPPAGIALGHRRLAIQDLSPAGAQPMASADGRYVITYNGEIYNAPDLRRDLEARGAGFRSTSDTEIFLAAVSLWGLERALRASVGMFAIGLWDRHERTLTLVRDRLGKKPLFWTMSRRRVAFGSELKVLLAQPGPRPRIDRDTLATYLRYTYVPSPYCIFEGVERVPPAGLVRIDATGRITRASYWDGAAIAEAGLRAPRPDTPALIEEAEDILRDAVAKRLISDVPLGAFLSGGIDSSLVVSLMQAQSSRPVKTFSIGFTEARYDESAHARAVAHHLGTDHSELIVTPDETLAIVPRLADWYDEPFADSSQIPTVLVSELARRTVTVALSGDGGDEIAAGYVRHGALGRGWPRLSRIPRLLRQGAAGLLRVLPPAAWDAAGTLLPPRRRPVHFGDKVHKGSFLLEAGVPDDVYRALITHWNEPARLVAGCERPTVLDDPALRVRMPDLVGRMQYLDMATYLPDDILCKVDRASMAVALEARCPLLDHRVVEFFWTVPRSQLVGAGAGKLLLRRILKRYVPEPLFERPKMGFGVPIEYWLRGPLRAWAEALIAPDRLAREGLIAPEPVATAWRQHQSGRFNHQYKLWTVLMFQQWRERWLGN